ncbi:MAG: Fe-S oxidoreductase [Desulfobulbus propionicus]|nr:MAG: Fe-S oxidoreductase [Desulfobulbus propionicus]
MQENMSIPEVSEIFECTRCGFCCHGETTVSLDANDQEVMVAALGLPREEVAAKYWRITGQVVQMQTVNGHCIFYDNACGCTVHAGRPWRCRQWPLHPSILDDEANFLTIRESCPGINQRLDYLRFCGLLGAILQQKIIEDRSKSL